MHGRIRIGHPKMNGRIRIGLPKMHGSLLVFLKCMDGYVLAHLRLSTVGEFLCTIAIMQEKHQNALFEIE